MFEKLFLQKTECRLGVPSKRLSWFVYNGFFFLFFESMKVARDHVDNQMSVLASNSSSNLIERSIEWWLYWVKET